MNDIEELRARVRSHFPSLASVDDVLLDNAGGSQMPTAVSRRMAEFFDRHFVQLGADYATSRKATEIVDTARDFVLELFGGRGRGQAILGASTSSLCAMLADAFARDPLDGRDEIVISDAGHEANIGPWRRLENHGYRIRWWHTRDDGTCHLDDLLPLLGSRTRVLAVHHVSNLLGRIEDVRAWTQAAQAAGARVVVDGVAYAPHRAIDVAAIGCDYYVFSLYKVFGPHMAALFGRDEALAELVGPNHDFIPADAGPYKWELGGVSYEGCAGLLGLRDYLAWLSAQAWTEDRHDAEPSAAATPTSSPAPTQGGRLAADRVDAIDRGQIERAFATMAALERPLNEQLLAWLNEEPNLRIIGPQHDGDDRVATISFASDAESSAAIAQRANAAGLGIRFGHFYAPRLAQRVGLVPEDGVVRTSCVHYSSPAELVALLEHFEAELAR